MLLPPKKQEDGEEAEDPRAELVRRLLEYEQMKLAAHQLGQITREELSVRPVHEPGAQGPAGRRFVEFETFSSPRKGSTVLVVTFIALLELAKETLIEITQAEAFAPIYVRLAYTPVWRARIQARAHRRTGSASMLHDLQRPRNLLHPAGRGRPGRHAGHILPLYRLQPLDRPRADRANAICQFCDTDFVGTDGTLGGKFATADAPAEPSCPSGRPATASTAWWC
ncbi:Synaptotagmin-3 [Manis javanica]|nr:Synaptotagmin-3 [Manis javanica]